MSIESLVFEYVLEILVVVLSGYATVMWRINKRLQKKANEDRLESIEDQLGNIKTALFGDEDLEQAGHIKDKNTELEELKDEVEENNKKIDTVLLILSDEMGSEHQKRIRSILSGSDYTNDNDYNVTDDD